MEVHLKIRHPWLLKWASLLAACVIRLWLSTLRYRMRQVGGLVHPDDLAKGRRCIYVFWHEGLLAMAYRFARRDVWVLISQHADGQLVADACKHLGWSVVRGSATRGGVEAVRQMLRISQRGHLAITPDGPRGPRRRVHPGVIHLAAHTGLPIVPVGVGYRRPWRLRSWDRFALPKPGSEAVFVSTGSIQVPPDATRDHLEAWRRKVEQELLRCTDLAERWAEEGRWPGLDAPPTELVAA